MPDKEQTKSSRNEVRKIDAAFNNSVAVGFMISGIWVPSITALLTQPELAQKLGNGQFEDLTRPERLTTYGVIVVTITSLICVRNFRRRAYHCLRGYED